MGLLNRKWRLIDWDSIKLSDKVYPEGSVALFVFQTKSGQPATGWIDKSYKKYKYKAYCPFNILIHVDFTDSIAENNPELDMGSVEDYFSENLRKIGIAHIVARLVTDKGMDIEFYVEKETDSVKYLNDLKENKDRLVSFEFEAMEDPKWGAFSGLLKI